MPRATVRGWRQVGVAVHGVGGWGRRGLEGQVVGAERRRGISWAWRWLLGFRSATWHSFAPSAGKLAWTP